MTFPVSVSKRDSKLLNLLFMLASILVNRASMLVNRESILVNRQLMEFIGSMDMIMLMVMAKTGTPIAK